MKRTRKLVQLFVFCLLGFVFLIQNQYAYSEENKSEEPIHLATVKLSTGFNGKNKVDSVTIFNKSGEKILTQTYKDNGIETNLMNGLSLPIHISKEKIIDQKFLLLDSNANIIEKNGKPMLVEKFPAKQNGTTKTLFSAKEGLSQEYMVFPCEDCSQKTGVKECSYVWLVYPWW